MSEAQHEAETIIKELEAENARLRQQIFDYETALYEAEACALVQSNPRISGPYISNVVRGVIRRWNKPETANQEPSE